MRENIATLEAQRDKLIEEAKANDTAAEVRRWGVAAVLLTAWADPHHHHPVSPLLDALMYAHTAI